MMASPDESSADPWTLLFAPESLDHVVAQPDVCAGLRRLLSKKDGGLPHMVLFVGPAGVGKSTLASIVVRSALGAAGVRVTRESCLSLNASGTRTASHMEAAIRPFCARRAGSSSPAVIILDEADGLTAPAQRTLSSMIAQSSVPGSDTFGVTFFVIANELHALQDELVAQAPHDARFTDMSIGKLTPDIVRPIVDRAARDPRFPRDPRVRDASIQRAIDESPMDVRGFIKSLQVHTALLGPGTSTALQPRSSGLTETFVTRVCKHFGACVAAAAAAAAAAARDKSPCTSCTGPRIAALIQSGTMVLEAGVPADRILDSIVKASVRGRLLGPACVPLFRTLEHLRKFRGRHDTALFAGILGVCVAIHGREA